MTAIEARVRRDLANRMNDRIQGLRNARRAEDARLMENTAAIARQLRDVRTPLVGCCSGSFRVVDRCDFIWTDYTFTATSVELKPKWLVLTDPVLRSRIGGDNWPRSWRIERIRGVSAFPAHRLERIKWTDDCQEAA
jgi:hypothetical protein